MSPVIIRLTSIVSLSANSKYPAWISPLSGASSTPPERLVTDSPAV